MNCDEYLNMLATVSPGELSVATRHDHATNCVHCERASRLVAEREWNRAAAYDLMQSNVPAHLTTQYAMTSSSERRINWVYSVGISLVLACVAWLGVSRLQPRGLDKLENLNWTVEEVYSANCLSGSQISLLARHYLGNDGTAIYSPYYNTVTVHGPKALVDQMHKALLVAETAASSTSCATSRNQSRN